MDDIWAHAGIPRTGFNYYFFPKPASSCPWSSRFVPTAELFQVWFGMYTVSDNDDGPYALVDNELSAEAVLELAIADQLAWLNQFAGLPSPSVRRDPDTPVTKEAIALDSQGGWKLTGRLVTNLDVGHNNLTTGLPELLRVPSECWQGHVESYQQAYLDVFMYVWYSEASRELNVSYFSGVEVVTRSGDVVHNTDALVAKLEEMVYGITVYQ